MSSDDKQHMTMIYLIDEDESYGGCYYALFWNIASGVMGTSRETIIANAYVSLGECFEDENSVPFDIKTIKESIVFDNVECYTTEELNIAISIDNMKEEMITLLRKLFNSQKFSFLLLYNPKRIM